MSLHPTKTRLELLRAVEAGEVTRHWTVRMDAQDRPFLLIAAISFTIAFIALSARMRKGAR
jgi:hypothetical protein